MHELKAALRKRVGGALKQLSEEEMAAESERAIKRGLRARERGGPGQKGKLGFLPSYRHSTITPPK